MASSGNATARAAAARLVLDKLTAHSLLNAELARRAASEEIQQRMQAEMPAIREKVALLIERRARGMAEQMTEAELANLVERRATEKAKELHEEQRRLELEAVKAELALPEESAGGA